MNRRAIPADIPMPHALIVMMNATGTNQPAITPAPLAIVIDHMSTTVHWHHR